MFWQDDMFREEFLLSRKTEGCMKHRLVSLFIICILCFSLLLYGCSGTAGTRSLFSRPLPTLSANPEDMKGTFTLLAFGRRHGNDLETVVIFDAEGDGYHFDLFVPDFDFKIMKGMPSKAAYKRALDFVNFHYAFSHTRLISILNTKGETIGFELRPLYRPFVYGRSDLLDVFYWPKEEGRVKVTIRLIPMFERTLFEGSDGRDSGTD